MPFAVRFILSLSALTCACFAHASQIKVYSCSGNQVVETLHSVVGNEDGARALLRKGHAVWANGQADQPTVAAIAEGRGVWAAMPITTLFEIAAVQVEPRVLAAVAMKESQYRGRFWPWTINFQGKGYYLPSKEKAVEAASYLIRSGHTNFDVSAMQINWKWNQKRFASIEAAFDPLTSIRVAEQILAEHYRATGSWHSAIGRYHSKTSSLSQPYTDGVLRHLAAISSKSTTSPEKKLC